MIKTDAVDCEPLWQRVLEFPLVVLVVATALWIVAGYVAYLILAYQPNMGVGPAALSEAAINIAILWAVYKLSIRHLGDKPHDDLPDTGAIRLTAQGLGIGFLLFSAIVGIAFVVGAYRIIGSGGTGGFLVNLAGFALLPGFREELLFRGIFFRWFEELGGTWVGLVLSSALFGFAHYWNPNSSPWASTLIAIEGGVLFGGAYMLTRSLWLPIGLHAAWNFTQGFIFGVPVSGITATGLVRSELSGPEWLSGGDFGLEASVMALLLATAGGVWMVVQAQRRGLVFGPMWTRTGAIVFPEQPPSLLNLLRQRKL
ncbi:MAG: type II CAAX endopeptidase family protein [Sphingomicrobium sp.]